MTFFFCLPITHLAYHISTHTSNQPTQTSHQVRIDGETVNVWDLRSSATYVQISIAVEILIFSCRTTGWFFLDMPSWGLIAGVMIANVVVSLCAVYGVIVSPHLTWEW